MKLVTKQDLVKIKELAELCKKKNLEIFLHSDGEFSITLNSASQSFELEKEY